MLEDPEKSYHAKHRVTDKDIFDNRLIFGDNLLALKALEQEFAGKIACVFLDRQTVIVHGYGKPTAKSPVKPASPGGPTRILLPVNDESDRGRKPVLRDELAVVASVDAYPREQLRQTDR